MQINKNKSLEDLQGEVWKDIPDYEGFYQISNMGRVKSLLRVIEKSNGRKMTFKSKILSLNKHYKNEYLSVMIRIFEKHQRKSIHRLVGELFVNNDEEKFEINHIDSDKSNNRFDNLEWVSRSENQTHMAKNKKKTSIYSGVYKIRDNKFISHICHNSKKVLIGSYRTELEAYQARKKYELENNINNKYS